MADPTLFDVALLISYLPEMGVVGTLVAGSLYWLYKTRH